MAFHSQSTKLLDCQVRGPGTDSELFIVEGDSASRSVKRMCDSRFQAVLPMQGKPLNAWKASKSAVERNSLYHALIMALGAGWGSDFLLAKMSYRRIIMLFDPDADGIHCGVLMSLFFYRWMPEVIDSERLLIARPPLFEITADNRVDPLFAGTDLELARILSELRHRGESNVRHHQYRGLASFDGDFLHETCLSQDTRVLQTIKAADIDAMIRIFQGIAK